MGKHQTEIGARRKHDILRFIIRSIIEHEYPPTFREIGQGVGIASPSHVHYYLHAMRVEGKVTFKDRDSRTLRVVGNDDLFMEVMNEVANERSRATLEHAA